MQVFIVLEDVPNEGTYVVGVFTSLDAAREYAVEHNRKRWVDGVGNFCYLNSVEGTEITEK